MESKYDQSWSGRVGRGGSENCHLEMIEYCLSCALSLLIESEIDGLS